MNGFITEHCKLIKLADYASAATSAVNGAGVDMQADGGWDGVLFFGSFGTAAADNFLKAQQSDDDGSSDGYSDLAGSAGTPGSSDEDAWLDIQLPRKRYVRPVAVRTTSTTLENLWALVYRGKKLPLASTVNVISGTIYGKQLYHPDEGTA